MELTAWTPTRHGNEALVHTATCWRSAVQGRGGHRGRSVPLWGRPAGSDKGTLQSEGSRLHLGRSGGHTILCAYEMLRVMQRTLCVLTMRKEHLDKSLRRLKWPPQVHQIKALSGAL